MHFSKGEILIPIFPPFSVKIDELIKVIKDPNKNEPPDDPLPAELRSGDFLKRLEEALEGKMEHRKETGKADRKDALTLKRFRELVLATASGEGDEHLVKRWVEAIWVGASREEMGGGDLGRRVS